MPATFHRPDEFRDRIITIFLLESGSSGTGSARGRLRSERICRASRGLGSLSKARWRTYNCLGLIHRRQYAPSPHPPDSYGQQKSCAFANPNSPSYGFLCWCNPHSIFAYLGTGPGNVAYPANDKYASIFYSRRTNQSNESAQNANGAGKSRESVTSCRPGGCGKES